MALILPFRYPGRFNNPNGEYPQGSFKNRSSPTAKDGSYLEKDWANDWAAFFQSLMVDAGIAANGNVDKVGSSQYFDALKSVIQNNISTDILDTVRINIPSATVVDLNTGAPDTAHLNVTGTISIVGFTVVPGKCYFVRFDGSLSLINSVNLVTQTGSNIVTSSGDTCIIRATADNVVEIMCYARAVTGLITASHTEASGTAGGTLSASTWTQRPLNRSVGIIPGASLASNAITLQPGVWEVSGYGVSYGSGNHRARIISTSGVSTELLGVSISNADAASVTSTITPSVVTLSSPTTLILQHWRSNTRASNGLGFPVSDGAIEIYGEISVRRSR